MALLRQQPDFPPGRTLFAEARSALDELLAAHDDMIRTAEALAKATDEGERKSLAARYDRLAELLSHHDAFHVDYQIGVLANEYINISVRACGYDGGIGGDCARGRIERGDQGLRLSRGPGGQEAQVAFWNCGVVQRIGLGCGRHATGT